jgi:hypothetical protein
MMGNVTSNLFFASGAICRSCSAFLCVGFVKRRCTISHAGVGPDSIKIVSGHITLNLCFASGGICGSRSAFWWVWGAKD